MLYFLPPLYRAHGQCLDRLQTARSAKVRQHHPASTTKRYRRTDQEVIMQVNPGKDIASTMARKKAEGARKGL